MIFAAVLVAAALACAPATAGDGFDASMADLRDSLASSAHALGARVPRPPLGARPYAPAGQAGRHGRSSGDPCLENRSLDALKLRWTFEPDPPAFYVKPAAVQVDFSGGACRRAGADQAIRRFTGTKDYDLVLVTDAGASETGIVLVTKGGMVAVSYGEFPTDALVDAKVDLPKLPVAKSLTESMKGKASLALLPK